MACDTPLSTCFCTTAGCGPYHEEGLDMLVMDQGDAYLAKILTDKGQAFADAAGWQEQRRYSRLRCRQKRRRRTGSYPRSRPTTWPAPIFWNFTVRLLGRHRFCLSELRHLHLLLPHLLVFRHPGRGSRKTGVRMKNWDSCMFPIFTVHTTGHNPRDTKDQAGPPALHAQAQVLCGQIRSGHHVCGLRPLHSPVPGQYRHPPGVRTDEPLQTADACAAQG
jgi:sulfhydrogenase subunit beta (sulfur reductase)